MRSWPRGSVYSTARFDQQTGGMHRDIIISFTYKWRQPDKYTNIYFYTLQLHVCNYIISF